VVVADIVVMLLANAGVLRATGHTAPDAWRRFAALMIDGFATAPDASGFPVSLLPPAPPEQQLRQSIAMLTGAR
jgi:hypothetical protein